MKIVLHDEVMQHLNSYLYGLFYNVQYVTEFYVFLY